MKQRVWHKVRWPKGNQLPSGFVFNSSHGELIATFALWQISWCGSCHCDQCSSPPWRINQNPLCGSYITSAAPLWPRWIRNNGGGRRESERREEEGGSGAAPDIPGSEGRIKTEKHLSLCSFSLRLHFFPLFFSAGESFSCGWRVSWEGGVSPTHSPPWCVISTYCQYAAIDFRRDWQTSNNGVSIWTKSFGDAAAAAAAAAIILLIRLIEWLCNRIHAGPRSRAQMRGRHGSSASWKADMSVRWSNAFDHRTENLFTIAFGWRTAKRSSIPSHHVALLSSFFLLQHHLFYLFSYFNKHHCGIEEERSLTWFQLLLAFLKTSSFPAQRPVTVLQLWMT